MTLIPQFLRRQADATKPSAKTLLTPTQERTMLAVLNAVKPHGKTFFGMRIDQTNINLTSNGTIAIQNNATSEWQVFDTLAQFEAACCEQAKN